MNAKLPNLELVVYKSQILLSSNKEFQEKMKDTKFQRCYMGAEKYNFSVEVFLQTWQTTSTGIDLMPDGSPLHGTPITTEAYTTVVHERITNTYIVFFGDQPAYITINPSLTFRNDLKDHKLKSLSESAGVY